MNKFLLHIVFLVLVSSCWVNQKTEYKAPSTSKKVEEKKFTPRVTIFHNSPDTSTIYISVSSNDLLYLRDNAGTEFSATMKINYRILDEESKIPIDTGNFFITNKGLTSNKTIVAQKKIKLNVKSNYIGHFKCKDVNREEVLDLTVYINKIDKNTRQHFLVLDENYKPIIENSTNKKKIWLAHPSLSSEYLWVRYYNRNFNVPPPPFSENKIEKFSYKADSTFKIQLNDTGFIQLSLLEKGFYHYQTDSSKKEGFTLYIYQNGFPEITKVNQLVEPMRYITSKSEYESIANGKDIKAEVDRFWLDKCGSKERAREIIKNYYGRVEKANKKFTSYIEGWKTDRGMIAIIFGEPYSVSSNGDTETWYYNNERAYSYISFTFTKVQNPFTDNDYMLNRDPGFKPQWYRAVESWRQGRSYSANNF